MVRGKFVTQTLPPVKWKNENKLNTQLKRKKEKKNAEKKSREGIRKAKVKKVGYYRKTLDLDVRVSLYVCVFVQVCVHEWMVEKEAVSSFRLEKFYGKHGFH